MAMEAMYWLIALAVLLVTEILTLGLTTIWFAGGCLVAFIISMFGGPLWLQILVFLAVSLIMLIFTRPVALQYLNRNRAKTNYESIPGQEGRVTERVDNFNETGIAVVNGQEWSARARDDSEILEPGDKVQVLEIKGVKLIVTKKTS